MKRVLLVEPDYYTQYPPLGLLKLSTLHKMRGDEVRFVRGLVLVTRFVPDEIEITSLFTWAWKPVWEAVDFYKKLFPRAKTSLGGVYASLIPKHAKQSGADEVVTGLVKEAEDLMPDYELVPEWHTKRQASLVFSSRGCIRKCGFCAVPKLEGKPFAVRPSTAIRHLIHPTHRRVILWDNNILGEPNWREVFAELKELGAEVDFNQGLDARLTTSEVAERISELRMPTLRLAYDSLGMRRSIIKAIVTFRQHLSKTRYRHMCCYALYNYKDTPQELFQRVRELLAWGVAAYPMRYQPLDGEFALTKDSYVAPNWTAQELEMVATARRVIGYGGAFPPYEGLVKKFYKATSFHEAFGLYRQKIRKADELEEFAWDLADMGRDHQFPVHSLAPA
jgi:hypothetical protein